MNTRAKWVEGVRDLYPNHLDEANNYFGVPAVAEQTGLSPSTIKDLLSRVPITSETNVLAPISRPACRIGNQPLYSQEQIDKVTERQRATGHRHLGGGDAPLSSITPAEARKRNLVSVEEIAEMANAQNPDGVHEQTVRRWARDADEGRGLADQARLPQERVRRPQQGREDKLSQQVDHGRPVGFPAGRPFVSWGSSSRSC
jgi:hypothetical protein